MPEGEIRAQALHNLDLAVEVIRVLVRSQEALLESIGDCAKEEAPQGLTRARIEPALSTMAMMGEKGSAGPLRGKELDYSTMAQVGHMQREEAKAKPKADGQSSGSGTSRARAAAQAREGEAANLSTGGRGRSPGTSGTKETAQAVDGDPMPAPRRRPQSREPAKAAKDSLPSTYLSRPWSCPERSSANWSSAAS